MGCLYRENSILRCWLSHFLIVAFLVHELGLLSLNKGKKYARMTVCRQMNAFNDSCSTSGVPFDVSGLIMPRAACHHYSLEDISRFEQSVHIQPLFFCSPFNVIITALSRKDQQIQFIA